MILLLGHQKGGVGKSTISINLAYQLSKKYDDTILYDLDSQNSAMLFNQLRKSMNLKTIDCIRENDADFNELVEKYKGNKNNLLLIDSGGYDSNINRLALIKADLIITPVGISQIEIFGLQKFRKILKEASEAIESKVKTNVLLNNIDSRSKSKIIDLQNYIKENTEYFNLLDTVIHTRADYKNSYGDGLTVKEYNKKGDAQDEVKALSKEIYTLLNN
jgi:chromosome partitioning protein